MFEKGCSGLGARGILDAFCSASGESSGESCATVVFNFVDERVTRLLGSGIDAGSDVLRRFGGMLTRGWGFFTFAVW